MQNDSNYKSCGLLKLKLQMLCRQKLRQWTLIIVNGLILNLLGSWLYLNNIMKKIMNFFA